MTDRIESYSPAPESQVEVEPVDRARSDERDPGFVPLTGEELLRQRWSVVRGCFSSPTTTMFPEKPSSRSAAAVRIPARDAPTMTTVSKERLRSRTWSTTARPSSA